MDEILLPLHPDFWDLIRSGEKTIKIQKDIPRFKEYPIRVIVYICGKRCVVGKFDCCKVTKNRNGFSTIHIAKDSVIEYGAAFSLKRSTGLSDPPRDWCYLYKAGGT